MKSQDLCHRFVWSAAGLAPDNVVYMAVSLAPSNLRQDSKGEMASNAIIFMDLIPLACILISLGHLLIDPSLNGAIAIVYGNREAGAVADRDGSATA